MRALKSIFILILLNLDISAQSNWTDKKLTSQISSSDSLTIAIDHHMERSKKKEANIIYYQGKKLTIHSTYYSDSLTKSKTDTTFVLTKVQLNKIDKFGRDLENHDLKPTDVVGSGSRTFYSITLNHNPITTDSKVYYSLILDLLKK